MVIVMIRLIERRGRRSAPQEAAPFLLPTVNNQPLNKKRFQQPTSEKRKDFNNQPLKKKTSTNNPFSQTWDLRQLYRESILEKLNLSKYLMFGGSYFTKQIHWFESFEVIQNSNYLTKNLACLVSEFVLQVGRQWLNSWAMTSPGQQWLIEWEQSWHENSQLEKIKWINSIWSSNALKSYMDGLDWKLANKPPVRKWQHLKRKWEIDQM